MGAADLALPQLVDTGRSALEAAHAVAARHIASAWARRDPGPVARLGRALAVLPPAGLGPLARQASARGAALDALRLAAAHCRGGGSPALLAVPVGAGRLIDVAEAGVRDGWGGRPSVDAEAAGLLAELFLRVDPTDSYLHAAGWAQRARSLTLPARSARSAVRAGPALLARVWCDWAGLARGADGLRLGVPASGAPGGPWQLVGVPLTEGGAVALRWVDGAIRVEAQAKSWKLAPGTEALLDAGGSLRTRE